ncbi:MAG: hypothetical protein WC059_00730 [Candidatus Paceibacterota bacterium]
MKENFGEHKNNPFEEHANNLKMRVFEENNKIKEFIQSEFGPSFNSEIGKNILAKSSGELDTIAALCRSKIDTTYANIDATHAVSQLKYSSDFEGIFNKKFEDAENDLLYGMDDSFKDLEGSLDGAFKIIDKFQEIDEKVENTEIKEKLVELSKFVLEQLNEKDKKVSEVKMEISKIKAELIRLKSEASIEKAESEVEKNMIEAAVEFKKDLSEIAKDFINESMAVVKRLQELIKPPLSDN